MALEPPYGALILVFRIVDERAEFLILHRAHYGPEYEGDWAWTPPSGARQPGETMERCAQRELWEEAGLRAEARPVVPPWLEDGVSNWCLFYAHVPTDVKVMLHDAEHDRFEWVSRDEMLARCGPAKVRESIEHGLRALGFM